MITLIATTPFGLEKIVKQEISDLGFTTTNVSNGKIEFDATLGDIPKVNLWLRCADRVLLKMAEFKALDFDDLFDKTKALPWENLITSDGKFTVNAKIVRSTIRSERGSQSIVKKAVVERLKAQYNIDWFEETGPEFTIQVSILKDMATLAIDTSGAGLHKRGYRTEPVEAPLKETLGCALVLLSFWNKARILIDPMCGSGTILIEAAMIARNMAPGLHREFVSEKWPAIPEKAWEEARMRASNEKRTGFNLQLFGFDKNRQYIEACKINAKNAHVENDIVFEHKDITNLDVDEKYGILISNPPYGIRTEESAPLNKIYDSINRIFMKKRGWSLYLLTSDKTFPNYFKRSKPDRVRKLYNGRIEVQYYQYFGDKPGKEIE